MSCHDQTWLSKCGGRNRGRKLHNISTIIKLKKVALKKATRFFVAYFGTKTCNFVKYFPKKEVCFFFNFLPVDILQVVPRNEKYFFCFLYHNPTILFVLHIFDF